MSFKDVLNNAAKKAGKAGKPTPKGKGKPMPKGKKGC